MYCPLFIAGVHTPTLLIVLCSLFVNPGRRCALSWAVLGSPPLGLLFPCFSFPSMFGVPCSVFGVLFFSFSASVFYKKLPPSALLPRTLGGLQLLVHFLFFFSLSVFHLRNLWFSFLTSFCSFPSSFIRVFIRAHPWLLFAFSFADPSHSRAAFCAHRRPTVDRVCR